MRSNSHPGSVLVVDDDPAVLGLLRQILSTAGYRVLEANDGKQAVRIYREDPVDLMVTDLIMPEQEGVETITKLRREFPKLRIIAISGAVGGKYLKVAELLGADAILQKPFAPQDFLDMVQRVLS